jgi:hypothetical protein
MITNPVIRSGEVAPINCSIEIRNFVSALAAADHPIEILTTITDKTTSAHPTVIDFR